MNLPRSQFFLTWLPLWARACLLYMHELSLLMYLHIPSVFQNQRPCSGYHELYSGCRSMKQAYAEEWGPCMSIRLKKSLTRLDCKPRVNNVDCILFRISHSHFHFRRSTQLSEEMKYNIQILKNQQFIKLKSLIVKVLISTFVHYNSVCYVCCRICKKVSVLWKNTPSAIARSQIDIFHTQMDW